MGGDTVRELIAQLGEEAAHNDLIGYDQAERWSFWKQLQAAGYRPAKITTPCEADCSAGVISIVRAAGELLGVNNLKHLSATYTGNMRTGFRTAGFQVLTASKYLTSDKYLRRGDILLNDAHHTAINLTNGTAVVPITPAALEKSGVEAIAREVIAGKWGNGSDRKKRLEAAGYSYAAVQAAAGEEAPPYEAFSPETVTEEFFGTLYSRFGFFAGVAPDSIVTPAASALGEVTRTDAKGNESPSVYAPEKLNEKDKYLYFLGGNDAVVEITAANRTGKKLLLVKDSYANAFLPYLLHDYDAVTVVDPRYYPGSVLRLAQQGGYTQAMVLYNLKSFASDTYIQFLPLAD